ncbi:MAG: hypothetical protein HYW71_00095 [Candidatus Niyogibacteria bacterium]|nr:hypothetical protein [Candidatus Niyogibacteria bacterium]
MNSKIRNTVIFSLWLIFAAYFFYEARDLFFGFSAEIFYPKEGMFLENSELTVAGKVKNASYIFLNGRRIFTDEKGFFKENFIMATGVNAISLKAENKYGRIIGDRRLIVVK